MMVCSRGGERRSVTCDATYSSISAKFSHNDAFSLSGMAWNGAFRGGQGLVLLAVVTVGEDWHNNHHHYMALGPPGLFLVGNRHHLDGVHEMSHALLSGNATYERDVGFGRIDPGASLSWF